MRKNEEELVEQTSRGGDGEGHSMQSKRHVQRHRGAQESGHLGVVSNSLWPKSGVCARAGRDEAQEASKDQIRRGLVATELRLYPQVSGEPREKLRQGSGRLRPAVWKARPCVSAEG